MSTYKCEFKAVIEWVDLEQRRVVVVYSDPYGHKDIRLTVMYKPTDTLDDVKQTIINTTPHQRFHFENEARKQLPGDHSLDIMSMLNTEMTYKLPTFDNEDV